MDVSGSPFVQRNATDTSARDGNVIFVLYEYGSETKFVLAVAASAGSDSCDPTALQAVPQVYYQEQPQIHFRASWCDRNCHAHLVFPAVNAG